MDAVLIDNLTGKKMGTMTVLSQVDVHLSLEDDVLAELGTTRSVHLVWEPTSRSWELCSDDELRRVRRKLEDLLRKEPSRLVPWLAEWLGVR